MDGRRRSAIEGRWDLGGGGVASGWKDIFYETVSLRIKRKVHSSGRRSKIVL